jgi:hypothetical protein
MLIFLGGWQAADKQQCRHRRGKTEMENRTARLTILIDPQKKKLFEEICAANDLTPSQVVRRLIRQYVIDNAGGRELPEWLKPNSAKAEE